MSQSALPRKANLGCGEDTRGPGWVDVDASADVDPDVVVDLGEDPWPFPDDHFELVEARHLLEHLPEVPWSELARIIRPSGSLVLTYPLGHTRFEDSTHRQFWNWHTAETITGDRKHGHEVDVPLTLADRDFEWSVGNEPLVWIYTHYRLWLNGPGTWMEQVPGFYGEMIARYIHE